MTVNKNIENAFIPVDDLGLKGAAPRNLEEKADALALGLAPVVEAIVVGVKLGESMLKRFLLS